MQNSSANPLCLLDKSILQQELNPDAGVAPLAPATEVFF